MTEQQKQLPAKVSSNIVIAQAPTRGGLQLKSYEEILKLANLFTAAGIIKDAKDESIAALKIMAGLEMGLAPFEAVNGLYIGPGGKVEPYADLLKNLIQRSGKWSYKVVKLTSECVSVEFYEDGKRIDLEGNPITYDVERATKAKLLTGRNSGTWEAWFQRMAFKQCLRDGVTLFMPGLLNLHSVGSATASEDPEEVFIQTIAAGRLEESTTVEATSVDEETGEVLETREVKQEATPAAKASAVAEVAREVGREDIAKKAEEAVAVSSAEKSKLIAFAVSKCGIPVKDLNEYLVKTFGTKPEAPAAINTDQLQAVYIWLNENKRK